MEENTTEIVETNEMNENEVNFPVELAKAFALSAAAVAGTFAAMAVIGGVVNGIGTLKEKREQKKLAKEEAKKTEEN